MTCILMCVCVVRMWACVCIQGYVPRATATCHVTDCSNFSSLSYVLRAT